MRGKETHTKLKTNNKELKRRNQLNFSLVLFHCKSVFIDSVTHVPLYYVYYGLEIYTCDCCIC